MRDTPSDEGKQRMRAGRPGLRRRIGSALRVLFVGVLALVLIVEAVSLIIIRREGDLPLPPTFGNFDPVRALLAKDARSEEFSFAVVGDPHISSTFAELCRQLRDMPLSFMVILGDGVSRPTPAQHQFLRAEWATELAMPFPVFYAVGNHDVDEKTFPLDLFEKTYGPTNFSFEYGRCLFIVLRALEPPCSSRESIEFLQSVLSSRRAACRRVFVFMHIPPMVSSDYQVRGLDSAGEFALLFDRFKVDYVFGGDYHGLARVKVRDTVYLVTGGGGGRLRKQKFGRAHHAMVIGVRPDSISERILYVDRKTDWKDEMEAFAIAKFHPWLEENRLAVVVANAGILGFWAWALGGFVRNRARRRPKNPQLSRPASPDGQAMT